MTESWEADSLIPGYGSLTLRLQPDEEGPQVATLVAAQPFPGALVDEAQVRPAAHARVSDAVPELVGAGVGARGASRPVTPRPAPHHGATSRAVLYLHGFVDYFFQDHMAEALRARGYDFYALDLRKYGRSLRPWQTPNYCTSLSEYDEEIGLAISMLRSSYVHVALMGHSTGGLIASLWAADHPGVADAVVLNSPWLDLNENWVRRGPVTWAMGPISRLAPRMAVAGLGPYYGMSIHASTGGEWDYDLRYKPLEGFEIRAGWLHAVRDGHARVRRGLNISAPVLLCRAERSGPHDRAHPDILTTDSVLNVEDMRRLAPCLGPRVIDRPFAGGIHDLSLAPRPVRDAFFKTTADFLDLYCPAKPQLGFEPAAQHWVK